MNPLSALFRACLGAGLVVAPVLWAQAATGTYQVQRGDTMDKVIHHTMPDSPLKAELLRQAFVQHNPEVFATGVPRTLKVGLVLNVPNHDELLRTYLIAGKTSEMPKNERKNWVRFP